MANCTVCVLLRAHILAQWSTRPITIVMKSGRGATVRKTLDRREGKWLYLADGTRVHLKDVESVTRRRA